MNAALCPLVKMKHSASLRQVALASSITSGTFAR